MRSATLGLVLAMEVLALPAAAREIPEVPPDPDGRPALRVRDIKSYCLDYNWGGRRSFARPGSWRDADPAQHIAWYKAMGVNVIQTFCVSCNGYAWYRNGFVPEQPGLKHDFRCGLKVNAVVARTYSHQEDDYWNIRADAGYKF